jgi:hypothetical protein
MSIFPILVALTVYGARAEGQQTGKIFRTGFLDPTTASGSAVLVDAFRQELSNLDGSRERISPYGAVLSEQRAEKAQEKIHE